MKTTVVTCLLGTPNDGRGDLPMVRLGGLSPVLRISTLDADFTDYAQITEQSDSDDLVDSPVSWISWGSVSEQVPSVAAWDRSSAMNWEASQVATLAAPAESKDCS